MESATCTYELKVNMTCDGCSNAISRILNKDPRKKELFNPWKASRR